MNDHVAVDTKTAQGRRVLHFTSLDEIVADAEKLAASPDTKMLGNWPLDQLLTHLATAINGSIDGMPGWLPWFVRLAAPLMKGHVLKHGMTAGYKLPRQVEAGFFPAAASRQAALDTLRRAVARVQSERMTAKHPAFGRMSHEEWTRLHLRHAELHLSFAVPGA
ncbi:MAG TPA: DUF1569 domain-containing protein [Pirellulales bacterium]|jgi:hypothetical protein|nr:DUF1569 domain-containing protein [Pirellulales bacterium]